MRAGDGKSNCIGFVYFENAEYAALADVGLHRKKFNDEPKISEIEVELKERSD